MGQCWRICLASNPDLCIAVTKRKDGSRAVLAPTGASNRSDSWEYDSLNHTLMSQFSKQVLDLRGTAVVQQAFTDSPSQKWEYDTRRAVLRNLWSPTVFVVVCGPARAGASIIIAPDPQQWLLVNVADAKVLFDSSAPPPQPPHHAGFFDLFRGWMSPQPRHPHRPQAPVPPDDYDDAPSHRAAPRVPARAAVPPAPRPPADYGIPPVPAPAPRAAFSSPIYSVTVHEHPEFVLDFGPSPQPGSSVVLSRPERMPLQCWLGEPRGNGFVLKPSLQPGLALGVNDDGGACMVREDAGAIWNYSDDDRTLRIAMAPDTWLFLAVLDGALNQWAPVVATPDRAPEQKWQFWPEQYV